MVVVLFSVSTYICTNVAQKRNEVISGTWVIVRTSQPMDFIRSYLIHKLKKVLCKLSQTII